MTVHVWQRPYYLLLDMVQWAGEKQATSRIIKVAVWLWTRVLWVGFRVVLRLFVWTMIWSFIVGTKVMLTLLRFAFSGSRSKRIRW